MNLGNGLHIDNLDLIRHDQIAHVDLLPSSILPKHFIQTTQ